MSTTCDTCGRLTWPGRYDLAPEGHCAAARGLEHEEVICLRLGYERQRARAESAESRADDADTEAQMMQERLTRVIEGHNRQTLRADRLESHWRTLLEEVERTQQWRSCRGMRPTTDCSELASAAPSVLGALERMALAALRGEEKP